MRYGEPVPGGGPPRRCRDLVRPGSGTDGAPVNGPGRNFRRYHFLRRRPCGYARETVSLAEQNGATAAVGRPVARDPPACRSTAGARNCAAKLSPGMF